MTLKDQVISVELAEKLRDLGFIRSSYWYWIKPTESHWNYKAIIGGAKWELMPGDQEIDADDEGRGWTVENECKRNNPEFYETAPAFSTTELGALLPEEIYDGEDRLLLRYSKHSVSYYLNTDMRQAKFNQIDTSNEANSRAKMLIYLKENKYL